MVYDCYNLDFLAGIDIVCGWRSDSSGIRYTDVAVRFEKAAAVVPATGVTLDKTTLNLMTGETAVLTAAAQPENTTDTLTWTTGNEAVATVADGVVTAVGAGSTVITATCGSVKAECTVTVTASPLTVSVGGKTSPLSRVGGEGETKYRAVLPYGSDVTIHVADASFLLVTDKKLYPLQFILYQYLNQASSLAGQSNSGGGTGSLAGLATSQTPTSIRMTITILVVIPIMLVYPIFQRYFVKGIMIGAVKG